MRETAGVLHRLMTDPESLNKILRDPLEAAAEKPTRWWLPDDYEEPLGGEDDR